MPDVKERFLQENQNVAPESRRFGTGNFGLDAQVPDHNATVDLGVERPEAAHS